MERIKNFLKKRRFLVLCLLVLCLVLTRAPARSALSNSSTLEVIRRGEVTVSAIILAAINDFRSFRYYDIFAYNRAMSELCREETRFINAEDPERVRLLRNVFPRFKQFVDTANSRQTIELRAAPTQILPGQTVQFEAIPSSETPDLGSRILAIEHQDSFVSLGRQWFGNNYRGTLRTRRTRLGNATFRVMTTDGHHSNSVSIVIAPDCSQLSQIFLSEGSRVESILQRQHPLISVMEGYTVRPTLFGEGLRGEEFRLNSPYIGIQWTVDDESIAKIIGHDHDGIKLKGLTQGRTTLRARYGSLVAQAPVEARPPWRRITPNYRTWPTSMPLAPDDNTTVYLGDTVQFVAFPPDETRLGSPVFVEWRIINMTDARTQYAALPDYSHTLEWTPTEKGVYGFYKRFVFSMTSEGVDSTPWSSRRRLYVTRPGVTVSARDTTRRRVPDILPDAPLPCSLSGGNLVILRKSVESIPTESSPLPVPPSPYPPPAEPPRPIKPLDGFVGRIGERIHLEAAPLDISKGHVFLWSSWGVYWVEPETGNRGRVMAYLLTGNSERAEWIPRRAGIYEWEAIFHYNTAHRRPSRAVTSIPQRIVIVE